MRRRGPLTTWVVALLLGVHGVGGARTGSGEEPFRAGTWDLTLSGAYSFSFDSAGRDLATVDGFHVIPHVGYFLTHEHGPGFLRGNFEVLAEPTLIHYDDGDESATLGGLAALGRWVFATSAVVRPYIEAGVGVLGGEANFRQTNCDVNFILEGGVGALVFVSPRAAFSAGYRIHHVSNGDACSNNLGLNSHVFILGISYFFP